MLCVTFASVTSDVQITVLWYLSAVKQNNDDSFMSEHSIYNSLQRGEKAAEC